MTDEKPANAPNAAEASKPKPAAPAAPHFAVKMPIGFAKPVPFFASGEFKRIILFGVCALALMAMMFELHRKAKDKKSEVERSNAEWAARMEAAKAAPPPPGQTKPGAEVLWDNMLVDEPDDAPLDDAVHEKGYQRVIQDLARMKPGESLKPKEDASYAKLLKNPAENRGIVVKLSGLLNKSYSNIRLESNQGPFDSVYRLYLVGLTGTEGFVVDVLERPDGIRSAEGPNGTYVWPDSVELEAVFIRSFKYETKNGQVVRAPFFVARLARKIESKRKDGIWTTQVMIGVGFAALVLMAVIFIAGRSPKPKIQNS